MKTFKINLLLMALFAITLGMTSCGGNSDNQSHDDMENHEANHEAGDEHAYACPMHADVTGNKGDKCSKCGMGLKMAEGGDHGDHDHGQETEQQGKEFTSAYICPMHCEGSGSDKPGKCPVCGMDYKQNEDYKANGQDEGDGHEGHDH